MATILQTSNIIWQNVNLTNELNINLEYDIHHGLLNIFVKTTNDNDQLPCHINILSNQCKLISNNEPEICYEISTYYIYDIIDENDNIEQIDFNHRINTSSSTSSFYDEQIIDNDDGYSTHSLDDIEQQSLAILSSKLMIPYYSSQHHYYSEQYVPSIRRLIEQLTWLNPFRKSMLKMMMNYIFT